MYNITYNIIICDENTVTIKYMLTRGHATCTKINTTPLQYSFNNIEHKFAYSFSLSKQSHLYKHHSIGILLLSGQW